MVPTPALVPACLFFLTLLPAPSFCAQPPSIEMECRDLQGRRQRLMQEDPDLGVKPFPSAVSLVTKKAGGVPIYTVRYAIDDFGRRVTPAAGPGKRDRYLLFFGCSYTLGEGVEGTETLPYFAGEAAPRYTPYNYGWSGYGPQQMLARLQALRPDREITERDGALVYLFIDDHVYRAAGFRRIATWFPGMPCYRLDRRGRLVRSGNFASAFPVRNAIARAVNSCALFRRLFGGLSFPLPLTEKDFRLVGRILEESRDLYRRKFHNDDFVVVLYHADRFGRRVIPYLEKARIRYLVIDDTPFHGPGSVLSPYDQHPAPKVYRYLAGRIVKGMGLDRRRPAECLAAAAENVYN